MAIKKIGLGVKSLFLLMIFLVISGLTNLIGKITSSERGSDSLIAQSGLINQARADDPSSDCGCTESDGSDCDCGGCGCGCGCSCA